MKKWSFVLAALAVVFAACLFFLRTRSAGPAPSPETVASEDAAVAAALARQGTGTVALIESNFARSRTAQAASGSAATVQLAPAGKPMAPQFTNFSAPIVLENMSRAVRQYGRMFGGNPVGTNPEIAAALAGRNPKGINFLNAGDGMRVNGNGELVDPWGTPYFFHQLSGKDMEIHSAGPDGIMWTADDLVVK